MNMENLLSIREFSKLVGLESSTLRYWDEIGLFSPAKRDPDTNYRFYTPDQIIAINFIKVLSELNTPLKTIAETESERDSEKIIKVITKQEKLLDMKMRKLREQYSILHTRRELILDGIGIDEKEIFISQLEHRAFISGPQNDWKNRKSFHNAFIDFYNKSHELRINLNFPIGGMYNDFEKFTEKPGQPNYFFSLDPTGNRHWDEGNYLIGYHRGYYGRFGDLPQRMDAYIKEHSLTVSGPLYAIYLHDEVCIKDPAQYLVRVSVAVSKE